jgi:hypothetical protein
MKREAIFRVAGIFLLSMVPVTLAAQYQNPDLKSGKKLVKNILILPPVATLVKSGMKGNEPLVAESRALESGLASVVRQMLSDKGCNILQDAFSSDALDQNADLKYALSDLQTRYDKLQILVNKKPKDVRKGRFSLGDEVANFSPGAAADALVFVRANGVIETSGKKAFVVITGMGIAYNRVALDISVVDAQTGSVLYFAKPASGGDFVGKPDSMKDPIDRSFSDFRLQYPPKNKSSLLVQIPASHPG